MNTWTWKTVDWSKAQNGDAIVDEGNVTFVEEVSVRERSNPDLVSPELRIELIEYYHNFEWAKEPGAGYSFSCYPDGVIPGFDQRFDDNRTRQEYFDEVRTQEGLIYKGIRTRHRAFNEAAVIRCEGYIKVRRGTKLGSKWQRCNNEVALENVMTNTCEKCHTDYNSAGQKLAPRSQWGWDTGESLSEILSSDFSINDQVPDSAFEGDY